MTKQEMADQLRARKDEIAELEELVKEFALTLKGQFLLKGSQITAFRKGLVTCFDWFDRKAIALKEKRDFSNSLQEQVRGKQQEVDLRK